MRSPWWVAVRSVGLRTPQHTLRINLMALGNQCLSIGAEAMELEGFWVFVLIITVSTIYILLLTRPGGDDAEPDDENCENSN